jgi:uncharacterized membrane protein YGL010W
LTFAFVILPLQLKFGPEKSRVVMLILFAIIFLGSSFIGFIADKLNFNPDALMETLSEIHFAAAAIAILLFSILLALISWCISQNIMKKKEF